MIHYSNVRSTCVAEPEEVEILSTKVLVRENIVEVHEQGTEMVPEFDGWQYDESEYSNNEYIQLLRQQKQANAKQLTDTQLALVEVYEMIGG